MINPDIHVLITKAARDMADTMDAQILAFFGSEEQARAYAHLFVIEQQPLEPIVGNNSSNGMEIHYIIETEIRIRPKTLAELEAEGLV
ncbi:hypothetical protein SEA_MEDIUMFRY_75 [Arthrobacter phage MediumFry]|nr:hypothetical protein SEA_MEDIUMFRY_75 [Arthrobacter phage MediumFry]